MIKLSILILTTPRRRGTFFQRLLDKLEAQVGELPVEIIGIYDNKRRSVGAKRNAALAMAQGEYVCFFDDDDLPSDDYISEILKCLDANPRVDVVTIECSTTIIKGGKLVDKHYSRYGIGYAYTLANKPDANGFRQWTGLPAHTCIWKSDIAKRAAFPDQSYGEDCSWVQRANGMLKTEARIEKPLYFYHFDDSVSETRG